MHINMCFFLFNCLIMYKFNNITINIFYVLCTVFIYLFFLKNVLFYFVLKKKINIYCTCYI